MMTPERHLTIHSGKSIPSVLAVLKSMTQDESTPRWKWNRDLPFYGTIEAPEFVLYTMPIQFAKNYLVETRGSFRREGDGLYLDLTLRPVKFVRIFFPIWISIVAFFFLVGIVIVLTDGDPMFLLGTAAMILFGFLLVYGAFHVIAKRTVEKLTETLS